MNTIPLICFASIGALLIASVGISAPSNPSVSKEISMPEPRAAHSASVLADGRILLAGGCRMNGCQGEISNSALLFDPKNQTFTSAGTLITARVGHRTVRLQDGGVLLIGGWTKNGVTTSIERFNPKTDRFEPFGALMQARDGFSATALLDGNILIAGGYAEGMRRLNSVEIFDPRTRRTIHQLKLNHARMYHTATRLDDGRVLIAGGSNQQRQVMDSLELFEPGKKTMSPAGNLLKARHKHAAVLTNGQVVVMGGAAIPESDEFYNSVESFDPKTGIVGKLPDMNAGRYKFLDAALALKDGSIFIGTSGTDFEILPKSAKHEVNRNAKRNAARLSFSTASPMPDGSVLIAGGYDSNIHVSNRAWILKP